MGPEVELHAVQPYKRYDVVKVSVSREFKVLSCVSDPSTPRECFAVRANCKRTDLLAAALHTRALFGIASQCCKDSPCAFDVDDASSLGGCSGFDGNCSVVAI